ncbi:MAG: hypothetical protein HQK51_13175 [Oligoflexia bacterium]|nr:hypothetical protein [Oligoflexia bacterium]
MVIENTTLLTTTELDQMKNLVKESINGCKKQSGDSEIVKRLHLLENWQQILSQIQTVTKK